MFLVCIFVTFVFMLCVWWVQTSMIDINMPAIIKNSIKASTQRYLQNYHQHTDHWFMPSAQMPLYRNSTIPCLIKATIQCQGVSRPVHDRVCYLWHTQSTLYTLPDSSHSDSASSRNPGLPLHLHLHLRVQCGISPSHTTDMTLDLCGEKKRGNISHRDSSKGCVCCCLADSLPLFNERRLQYSCSRQ